MLCQQMNKINSYNVLYNQCSSFPRYTSESPQHTCLTTLSFGFTPASSLWTFLFTWNIANILSSLTYEINPELCDCLFYLNHRLKVSLTHYLQSKIKRNWANGLKQVFLPTLWLPLDCLSKWKIGTHIKSYPQYLLGNLFTISSLEYFQIPLSKKIWI